MYRNNRPSKQSGFVLVLAIGAILVLTLIVATVALNVQGLVGIATNMKAQEQVVWNSTSARSRVIYALLTGHKTFHGFTNESLLPRVDDMGSLDLTPSADDLRVDGRWYLMNGFPFSVQDKAGLLSANTLSVHEFERLFAGQLPQGTSIEMISRQYQDFIDEDDSPRFMGAESFSYTAQNLRGPANRIAFLPKELKNILSWPNAYVPWDVLHTEQLVWNINTAPQAVLSIKTAANYEQVERFLSERENGFVVSDTGAEQLLGPDTVFQEKEEFTAVVSNRFRIALISKQVCSSNEESEACEFSTNDLIKLGDVRVKLLDVTFTPGADDTPYRIDNAQTTSLHAYWLARELAFPIAQNTDNAILSTFIKKDANILNNKAAASAALSNSSPINDLIKVKDVPIIEYKNKTIPF